MKINELRIGNILKGETREGSVLVANVHEILECEVSLIFEGRVHRFTHDRIEPIPLTPEMFKNLIDKDDEPYDLTDGVMYTIGYLDIAFYGEEAELLTEWSPYGRRFKYFHELQNLIYCLTGEELNYTP